MNKLTDAVTVHRSEVLHLTRSLWKLVYSWKISFNVLQFTTRFYGSRLDAYVNVSITNGENSNPISPLCGRLWECSTVNIDLYKPRANLLDYSSPNTGSFLVRVPEPESAALLGFGAFAFLGTRRKSRKQLKD